MRPASLTTPCLTLFSPAAHSPGNENWTGYRRNSENPILRGWLSYCSKKTNCRPSTTGGEPPTCRFERCAGSRRGTGRGGHEEQSGRRPPPGNVETGKMEVRRRGEVLSRDRVADGTLQGPCSAQDRSALPGARPPGGHRKQGSAEFQ